MNAPMIVREVSEGRQAAHELLPARDFSRPGPMPMSLEDVANKIGVEYSEALALLGKI